MLILAIRKKYLQMMDLYTSLTASTLPDLHSGWYNQRGQNQPLGQETGPVVALSFLVGGEERGLN